MQFVFSSNCFFILTGTLTPGGDAFLRFGAKFAIPSRNFPHSAPFESPWRCHHAVRVFLELLFYFDWDSHPWG